jgi:hypothetical protein
MNSQRADIALIVTVCPPVPPSRSDEFKLALHPESPSAIFCCPYHPPDSSRNLNRLKPLMPGEEYDGLLPSSAFFVLSVVSQKAKKGATVSFLLSHLGRVPPCNQILGLCPSLKLMQFLKEIFFLMSVTFDV